MGEPITLIDPDSAVFNKKDKIFHDGILLEKGVNITTEFLEKNEDLMMDCLEKFSAYPDVYLDLITPVGSNFSLFFYQRIFLRACMRYQTIFITATRAASKTFLSILGKYLQCMFIPHHVGAIVAPSKTQASTVAKQKIQEIWRIWPLLKNELEEYHGEPHANFGKDYITLYFKNGSTLSVVGAMDSSRGLRTHATLIDEARDQDGDAINEIVLPQMSVERRMENGLINPYEKVNGQVIYATSAGSKASYAYGALIDTFEQAIINPKSAACIGLDYRIPVMHGLVDKSQVQKFKLSPSYSESTFAAEYGGVWQGGSDQSWFNFDSVSKRRKKKNPEWQAKDIDDSHIFYTISVDVARSSTGDQSVALVLKNTIKKERIFSQLVNLYILGKTAETKTFIQQSRDIKELIQLFKPREVCIDLNGLGVGLGDCLIQTQYSKDGRLLQPYGFKNQDDYKKVQPKDAPQILYGLKANGKLNSEIHANAYARLNNGSVQLLVTEQEARSALLATKVWKKKSYEERVARLMPHELTTKLLNQLANLRLKSSGTDIVLEQINSRYPKDMYSALAYGLWRIHEMEEEIVKKNRRNANRSSRKLVFFTEGA